MNREEAIRAMLDGKKVRNKLLTGKAFIFYQEGFFKLDNYGFVSQAVGVMRAEEDWEIFKEPRKRQMTRNEVLGFLANTRGVVVRNAGTSYRLPGFYDLGGHIENYEYAYIDEKGNIGEPMKFEVEE